MRKISDGLLRRNKNLFIFPILILLIVPVLISSLESVVRFYYKDKISYNVFVSDINVSGFDKNKFFNLLDNKMKNFDKVTISAGSSENELSLSDINYSIDHQKNWESIYKLKKPYLNNIFKLSFISFYKKMHSDITYSFDDQKLASELEKVTSIASTNPVFESIVLTDNNIQIRPGKDGLVVDEKKMKYLVLGAIQKQISSVSIPLDEIQSSIAPDQRDSLLNEANNLIGKRISVVLDNTNFEIADKDLVETLNDRADNKFENIERLSTTIINNFDREPKNSVFVFENGKVTEFTPSEDGIITNKDALKKEIIEKRNELSASNIKNIDIPLPHTRTGPEITMGNINNFGIKEKIGTGYSTFTGSIASRIYNIKLASSKFNGVLIEPGETMSFNKTLGDVSKVTGYQQAYIIRDGQTILGDGGGVCQVSTTLFRAALNTGLPIVERRSHSYRVGYYEQGFPPGLDATVFDPTTDLKIKNDTGNYVLIQTTFNEKEKKLTFDLYGTKDNRIVTLTKPIIKESTPPPEDLYTDDPTLKTGVIKQIDYKAWGAKVSFSYKVEKDSIVLFEKIFYSNYQPWQAKFLRGTGV